MPLFSFRRTHLLRPEWSLETQGPNEIIWKLLISPVGILIGEERDVEAKTSSLFAIELATGRTLWRGVRLEEPWWFGTERATHDTLYIQTFRQPDLPEAKGIIALDLQTGRIRWTQADLAFLFASGDKAYAMKQGFTHREYFELDAATGAILESFGEDNSTITELRTAEPVSDPDSYFAESLGEEREHFDRVRALLSETLSIEDLRGSIDYLEYERYLILSFHHRLRSGPQAMLQNLLASELLVIDTDSAEAIFRETLHRETPLPLPDNFFVSHRTLIYVKEKRLVAGVRLP